MKVPSSAVLTGPARRVAHRGWVWLRDPEGRREERAATSLVMFIVFFPLIVGSFGVGVDVARNIWVRTSLQNNVDTAVVGGAAVTTNERGFHIDAGPAQAEIRKLYKMNRADNPGLKCFSGPYCWQEPFGAPVIGVPPLEATYTVREQTSNAFLQLLGQPTQQYNLRGHAKVSLANR